MASRNHNGKSIQPLPPEAIAAMVTGPVISDLASCVKELLENAIDAGAQQINIRLFNKGLDIIEVSDDGFGIPATSRPFLAQPHATSKQLRSGVTLGFRGEALYSLAQVSRQLVIATRTADEAVAQKLEFSSASTSSSNATDSTSSNSDNANSGPRISSLARKVGTTVAVVGFLHSLPVRQHDLQQRLAYYRHQLRHLVLSYILCYAPRGIQIHWMDLTNGGSETSVLRSPPVVSGSALPSLRDTVVALWGPPMATSLSDVSVDLSDWVRSTTTNATKDTTATDATITHSDYRIEGLVSSLTPPTTPSTSKTKSACYFTIHGRPVDLPQVTRLLNDVFRTFVTPARPCVAILHLTLPTDMYDVNLSPDKRMVRFLNEEALYPILRDAVQTLWSAQQQVLIPKTVDMTTMDVAEDEKLLLLPTSNHSTGSSITTTASRSYHRRYAFVRDPQQAIRKQEMNDLLLRRQALLELGERLSPRKRRRHSSSLYDDLELDNEEDDEEEDGTIVRQPSESNGSPSKRIPLRLNIDCIDQMISSTAETRKNVSSSVTPSPAFDPHHPPSGVWNDEGSEAMATQVSSETSSASATASRTETLKPEHGPPNVSVVERKQYRASFLDQYGFQALSSETVRTRNVPITNLPRHVSLDGSTKRAAVCVSAADRRGQDDMEGSRMETDLKVPPPEERLRSSSGRNNAAHTSLWASTPHDTEDVIWASLRDRVASLRKDGRPIPTATPAVVTKEDFSQMTILGQFNLGFILASTPNGNLWIFDQHACDEIYNFESLRRSTTLYEQPLIAPLPLELSLAEEACILDHRDIFTANGFRLQYNDAQPPRHRWSLTALPHSGAPEGRNAVQYGPSDVQALCAILLSLNDDNHDSTVVDRSGNNAVRRYSALPKTIALWASRACRGSVMIGQALSRTEMERIVQRLSSVEDPWHCPHGRPTLCHVHAMEPIRVADERDHAEHIAGPTLTVVHPTATEDAIENDNK